MIAEYIQDCSFDSPLLRAYAARESKNPELKLAGPKIKKAIAELNLKGYFAFNLKNLNDKNYFKVERFTYQKELYAVATNSAVNYFFKIRK